MSRPTKYTLDKHILCERYWRNERHWIRFYENGIYISYLEYDSHYEQVSQGYYELIVPEYFSSFSDKDSVLIIKDSERYNWITKFLIKSKHDFKLDWTIEREKDVQEYELTFYLPRVNQLFSHLPGNGQRLKWTYMESSEFKVKKEIVFEKIPEITKNSQRQRLRKTKHSPNLAITLN